MSADYPTDLKYTKEHEWTRMRGDVAVVGITRFAVDQLGDVTQLDLPKEGAAVTKDEVFGTVESVKAVSDLYAPVSGKVVKVNGALNDTPELINNEPYAGGWLIEIKLSEPDQAKALLDVGAYEQLVAEQG